MLGKLAQLLSISMEDGFRVVEGVDFCMYGTADLMFANLYLYYNPSKS